MPRLVIDNIPVEVPPGTNVLEAAKKVGIVIPHFCYHEALGSVGACRLCAMKFLEGPVKGVQMSCMIPAQDGMVVSTTDGEAARLRQLVIEWLMINHPHDCPVCDEGGECLLQDYTVAGGHGIRRYKGKKRTFLNQNLGPYIEHEMNRCIECYRCVRFYQEYAGGTDLGTMGSAGRVYFGRFADGQLESPFSGNLLDICPTGVYTDKTARFRARYWDYDMSPSVCPHCSLGCNTTPMARYRELLRTGARRNDTVNGFFICDRGRFTNHPVNDPARPRFALVDGAKSGWEEALDALVQRIDECSQLYGARSIAVVGSSRLSLEALLMLQRLGDTIGAGFFSCFADSNEAEATTALAERASGSVAASMADVRSADLIAICDCDVAADAPMMALALRQAWRRGGRIFTTGSTPEGPLERTISLKVAAVPSLDHIPLDTAQRAVFICGATARGVEAAAHGAARGAKVAPILGGPNAFGAAAVAGRHGGTSLAEAVATGKVKGIIAVEADLPGALLEAIPFIFAADWLPTEAVARAQVVLPTTAWVEMDGTYVNNEGRAQRFRRAMKPGIPVRGLDPALHPPHVHRFMPPGGDLLPAWQCIAEMLRRLTGERNDEPFHGEWEPLRHLDPAGEGMRIQWLQRTMPQGTR